MDRVQRMQSGNTLTRVQSGDSIVTLQDVPPTPTRDTPLEGSDDASKKDAYFGSEDKDPKSTSFLGLSGHSTIWWLTRIQRYSSYTFTGFATLHITNTAILPLATRSIPASDSYLLLTRPYYQSALFEPLLVVAPLVAHVGSGIALRFARRHREVKHYGAETRFEKTQVAWPAVSGISAAGMALAPLAAAHAFVNRGLPLEYAHGSSGIGLGYVAHGFAKHPAVFFVAYGALVGLASWHFSWGWAKWLGLLPEQSREDDPSARALDKKKRWYLANGAAALVAGVWALGGLGVVGKGGEMGGWQGKLWDDLYQRIPVLGRWW